MPHFRYSARDQRGERQSGVLESGDISEAAATLRARGLFIVELAESRDVGHLLRRELKRCSERRRKVSLLDLAVFCRQFAAMYAARVPVVNALRVLGRQNQGKELGRLLEAVATDLEGGDTLAGSFTRHGSYLPEVFVNMMAAGEVGGVLEAALERLADHFEKEHRIAEKIRAATAYPKVVGVVAFIVIILMLAIVLPSFAQYFGQLGAELPAMTRALLSAGDFLKRHWWGIPLVLVLVRLAWWAVFLRPDRQLWLDGVKLRLPIFGELTYKRAVARFARTLSTLLQSGVPVLVSLEVAKKTLDNRYLGEAIGRCQQAVLEGESLAAPMRESGIFTPMFLEMIAVGEETGELEQMLAKVAGFYDEEVNTKADKMAQLLEPVIIVVLAVVVGGILLSIVVPMFDIYGQIG
ncbi:MAG: type II secretion system F family protein [Bacillota bacterium]